MLMIYVYILNLRVRVKLMSILFNIIPVAMYLRNVVSSENYVNVTIYFLKRHYFLSMTRVLQFCETKIIEKLYDSH